ncbi:metal ABC transporter solute-binding protein, Zn/Mn family [Ochrovirga pacifica]|uniref:metal ABC transporter solute-binding protein, Zn/Mn family n=1 Tax=Ochrovirga pacifica TaxID=1042376 RepID=UPI000255835C|nr:zinc ABC transporter substrate-binding protein [Ochrovirga pacifica]
MKKIVLLGLLSVMFVSCNTPKKQKHKKFTIVCTTTMITDLVKILGGDAVEVQGMMGAGVDPHLYKASAGDLKKLTDADVIVYNGLHLEGKLVDVFDKMNQIGKKTIAVGSLLPKEKIIHSQMFASAHDPHIWFSIDNWKMIAEQLVKKLSDINPENSDIYEKNGKEYVQELQALKQEIAKSIAVLSKEKRILVTAHDAFSYFGKEFDFEVVGLQGLSTATEAGVKDVQRISDFIIRHQIKAVFIESSVPKRTVKALQAAVKSKGQEVNIGGELFSDALGNPSEKTGSYVGMYRYNVATIVNALK